MSVRVSVIIPVYNAEAYLPACIESLIQQTLRDCEFIFVNDGSVDGSEAIIRSYQTKDDRIKLVNQQNQGVSAARNRGIAEALGEYIGFVDADDTVEPGMYGTLLTAASNHDVDLVMSNFVSEQDGHSLTTRYPFPTGQILYKEYIQSVILPYFLRCEDLNTVWTKLYRTEIIRQYQVRFPEKVALGEDGLFNMRYLAKAASCFYLDYTGYHYREVLGSATRNIQGKDYFSRSLEVFHTDYNGLLQGALSEEKIFEYKSMKLVNSVLAYIHIYFGNTKMRLKDRYSYVRRMLHDPTLRQALPVYLQNQEGNSGAYGRLMLESIARKWTGLLYLLTVYSRWRNR